MERILIILLFIITLFGCVTPKKIERKCAKWGDVCTVEKKDSIHVKEVVVYRDTVVYIEIYKDTTVYKYDTVYIDNGVCYSEPVSATGNYSDAKAWIYNNLLNLELNEYDSLLPVIIDSIPSIEKVTYKEKIRPVRVKYTPEWVKALAYIGVISLLVGFIILIVKVRR
jgi:hypothetical protein